MLKQLEQAKRRVLEGIGAAAEGYAKLSCPVDTGRLRASVAHAVQDDTVYVGTNVEYAPYVEYGTGRYVDGGTDKEKWYYYDAMGEGHVGMPQPPRPFLKPAISEHTAEYRNYIEQNLK